MTETTHTRPHATVNAIGVVNCDCCGKENVKGVILLDPIIVTFASRKTKKVENLCDVCFHEYCIE